RRARRERDRRLCGRAGKWGRSWVSRLQGGMARLRVRRALHVKGKIEALVAVLRALQRRHELRVGEKRRAVDVAHHVRRRFGESLDVDLSAVEIEFAQPGSLGED